MDPSKAWARVRARRPLVACLHNHVSAGLVAQGLDALGASPAMVSDPDEAVALVAQADALSVNLGTLDAAQEAAVLAAVAAAERLGRPWVLDPVGVGALPRRTRLARTLLARGPTAVRANASEVVALAGGPPARGVDADGLVEGVEAAAGALLASGARAVAATGCFDLVRTGEGAWRLDVGVPALGRVVGSGCLASAAVAAALGADLEPGPGALAALALLGLAGEAAAEGAPGPGTFVARWLDALAEGDATLAAGWTPARLSPAA